MKEKKKQNFLHFLYHTKVGRILLWLLKRPFLSSIVGFFLNRRVSKIFIKPFAKKNKINLDDFEVGYNSFNDFFTRKIKEVKRPIDKDKTHFISPCDAYLSAYRITNGLVIPVKYSSYSIESLLKNKKLAKQYENKTCLVFRLCVNHYHRYCYIDDGKKGENIFIPGFLHTVRPIALENIPVFVENQREYTVMDTKNFGTVTEIEVGALMVGKIKNHKATCSFKKGEEKGMFLFGGSTIILLVDSDKVCIDEKFFKETEKFAEVEVKMGEKIGIAIK